MRNRYPLFLIMGGEIIPKLPLDYLSASHESQKEDISSLLLSYYDNKISDLHKSILNIYQQRKDVTEKLIDPVLNDEKNILEEKLTSGEIDKNLYGLNNIERDLFRKTRETFLELKRMEGYIYICEFWTNKVYVLSEGFRLLSSISSSEKFQAHFNAPCGVAFADKYMFICDHMHHQIHRFIIVTSQS